GSLTPQQRARAETDTGLPFAELKENQQKLLRNWAISDEYSASVWKDQALDAKTGKPLEFVALKLKQSQMRVGEGPWVPIWSISIHRKDGTGSGTFLDVAQMLNSNAEDNMKTLDSCGWIEIELSKLPVTTVR
ncbi:MAG: hypothetical protein QME62_09945, partial [Armatimonadota bacterium]|nr:hypothetical protein [Armatimonadota bacterium]